MTTIQVGQHGEIILPPEMRTAAGIRDQSYVVVEQIGAEIRVRPAALESEIYTPERIAEFLVSNALDAADYAAAVAEARKMGLGPPIDPLFADTAMHRDDCPADLAAEHDKYLYGDES
jgi:hypothetical protein